MGCSKSSSERDIYSNISYLKKQEKQWLDNINLYLKQLEKGEKTLKLVDWKKL